MRSIPAKDFSAFEDKSTESIEEEFFAREDGAEGDEDRVICWLPTLPAGT
jgi:hypothetical protein